MLGNAVVFTISAAAAYFFPRAWPWLAVTLSALAFGLTGDCLCLVAGLGGGFYLARYA